MEPTHRTLGLRRSAALAAVAAAAALALPGAANAAVTGQVTGTNAVLTGDDTAETITIGVDNGLLTHNLSGFDSATDFDSAPGITTLPALTGTLTIDGAGGDDNITGGPNADHLIGGAGSDRLTGFKGDDDKDGGLGNDTFIWNNGDGTDTDDGDDGADEQVINGRNTTDDMTVKNVGSTVRFDRADPGKFGINMQTIERLSINSLQGDDKLVTDADVTLPITVDAGAGADAITTGGAADLVQGGEGADVLDGGPGGDRILGNPGNDVVNGNAGDDTLVWNNGDGTDDLNGQDGLDRVEDNLGAANDISLLKVVNGKVRYDRTNAPFGLNVASSELFELNTLGGDDTAGTSGAPYLRAMARATGSADMLAEQVWDGRPPTNRRAGEGTRSATPLTWSHAGLVRLAW